MKVLAFHLNDFQFDLKPVDVRGGQVSERRGIGLVVQTEKGLNFKGEAAPLPGVHDETLEVVASQLNHAGESLIGRSLSFGLCDEVNADYAPAVRFALEQIFFAAALQTGEVKRRFPPTDEQCGLIHLSESSDSWLKHLPAAGAVKVKIGLKPWHEEADRLKQLASMLPAKVQLRLDANQTFGEARGFLEFWEQVKFFPIEFVEEPLADGVNTAPLLKAGVPLAYDESLWNTKCEEWPREGTFVIKPTRILAITGAARLAESGASVVLSSTYDSSFTHGTYKTMAEVWPFARPLGLGTSAYVKDEVS